ncbi:uncharacterized protein LOC119587614 [Penaeus monodon]|uniref:uncharacterized protein LOC119587614 n=1 Tax=Penaeus monodon TaxID=6687 RepID=UPI0018A6D5AE|nr:uncharacterized protein LOC119587614 [Penaeus monodon]
MSIAAAWVVLLAGVGTAKKSSTESFRSLLPAPPGAFVVPALLVYPPPMPFVGPYADGGKDPSILASVKDEATKTVNKERTIEVFSSGWDDMETCPSWCKDEEGGLFCCGFEGKNKHSGTCPPLRDVCIFESDVKQKSATYCMADDNCSTKEKCCFDRCLQARVCKTALKND